MGTEEVKIRRKVQLRKKAEEEEITIPQGVKSASDSLATSSSTSSSKKWLWIIPVVVVLLGLVYFLGNRNNESPSESGLVQMETENNMEESINTDETETVELNASVKDVEGAESSTPNNGSPKEELAKDTSKDDAFAKPADSNVSGDVEAEAMKVIRGIYGDGEERKEKLGSNYQTIQTRVNELKRKGVF
jgi:hypothetical protein